MSPTTLIELAQVGVAGLAVACSAYAASVHLRTWAHLALLEHGGDRRLRIAAFAFVGRELLRLLICVAFLIAALISIFWLPSPPQAMPYVDWLVLRKAAMLSASFLLLASIAWDLWLRDVLRQTKD